MSFRNAFGIYQVIEQLLKASDRPLTCVDLFDSPEVKRYADDANRVSDYLGHLYRRQLLKRFPAPKDGSSMARYAYMWKDPKLGSPAQRHVQPRLFVAKPQQSHNGDQQHTVLSRPNIEITDGGGVVTIELPNAVLTIRTK